MAEVATQLQASFVVSTGDNFYMEGVTGVDDVKFKQVFEDRYTHPSLQIPW